MPPETPEPALTRRLATLREGIATAARTAGRNADGICLLAVSKTHHPVTLRAACLLGVTAFGESYVQEALPKQRALVDLDIDWHFIGPIQSNKTREIAEGFAWVHALDRSKIADRLAAQRPAHLPPVQICVQVNISGEETKSGVAPAEAAALCRHVAGLHPGRIVLRGLMAIPEPLPGRADARASFRDLRELRDGIRAALPEARREAFDTLSMGMSEDYAEAIAEGATIVRVGSALFGTR